MGKRLDKLTKLEDYKPPWEEKGDEYDPEKGKSFIHYLLRTKAEAEDALDESKASLTTITQERDALKGEKEAKVREGESETDRLKRERDEAVARAEAAEKDKGGAKTLAEIRFEVALEKGLTKAQVKRLDQSLTKKEDIEADADELLESWGGSGESGDGAEDTDTSTPRTGPKRPLRNNADPGGEDAAFDPNKEADAYVSGRGGLL
jgi:hypothetical protein